MLKNGVFFPKNALKNYKSIIYYELQFTSTISGGGVAQLVEQRTENPCVASSTLALATIFSLTNEF